MIPKIEGRSNFPENHWLFMFILILVSLYNVLFTCEYVPESSDVKLWWYIDFALLLCLSFVGLLVLLCPLPQRAGLPAFGRTLFLPIFYIWNIQNYQEWNRYLDDIYWTKRDILLRITVNYKLGSSFLHSLHLPADSKLDNPVSFSSGNTQLEPKKWIFRKVIITLVWPKMFNGK